MSLTFQQQQNQYVVQKSVMMMESSLVNGKKWILCDGANLQGTIDGTIENGSSTKHDFQNQYREYQSQDICQTMLAVEGVNGAKVLRVYLRLKADWRLFEQIHPINPFECKSKTKWAMIY